MDPADEATWTDGKATTVNYNCFTYGFDLVTSERCQKIIKARSRLTTKNDRYFPNSLCARHLIDAGLLKLTRIPLQNVIIIYFSDDKPKHAGKIDKVLGDKVTVISKWGKGWLWRHPLCEVPSSYGDAHRYYQALAQHDKVEAFVEWIKGLLGIKGPSSL